MGFALTFVDFFYNNFMQNNCEILSAISNIWLQILSTAGIVLRSWFITSLLVLGRHLISMVFFKKNNFCH